MIIPERTIETAAAIVRRALAGADNHSRGSQEAIVLMAAAWRLKTASAAVVLACRYWVDCLGLDTEGEAAVRLTRAVAELKGALDAANGKTSVREPQEVAG